MKAQLTIRDLFWLVLVVGVGCAWWVDKRASLKHLEEQLETERKSERSAIAKELEGLGLHLMYYGGGWNAPEIVFGDRAVLRRLVDEDR